VTHDQTTGKTGYTGGRLQDRLTNAGYVFGQPNAIGEVISATSNGSGFYMAEELITAIYHRFVIFEPVFQEIGAGAASTSANYNYFTADFVTNLGYGNGIAAGTVVTWPFNGQTQVPVNFFSDCCSNIDDVLATIEHQQAALVLEESDQGLDLIGARYRKAQGGSESAGDKIRIDDCRKVRKDRAIGVR